MDFLMKLAFGLGLVGFVLLLFALVPVGVLVLCRENEIEVHATISKKKFILYPAVTRKQKEGAEPKDSKRKSKPKQKKPKSEKSKVSGKTKEKNSSSKKKKPKATKKPKVAESKLEMAVAFVPLVVASFQRLGRYKKIDQLELELIVGSSDPVEATVLYGKAQAFLGMIWLPLDQGLNIQKGRAGVRLDFEGEAIKVNGVFAVSLTVGQIITLICHLGYGSYKILGDK